MLRQGSGVLSTQLMVEAIESEGEIWVASWGS